MPEQFVIPVRPDPQGLVFTEKRGFGPDHQAVDLKVRAGEPVLAPESGEVWLAANENDLAPFEGMGPAFVFLHGDSGLFHLLAEIGAVVKTAGKVAHAATDTGEDQFLLRLGPSFRVAAGDVVGIGGAKGIVHWELMPAPPIEDQRSGLTWMTSAQRLNPLTWYDRVTRTVDDPPPGGAASTEQAGGRGGGLFLLAVGYFVGKELRWW